MVLLRIFFCLNYKFHYLVSCFCKVSQEVVDDSWQVELPCSCIAIQASLSPVASCKLAYANPIYNPKFCCGISGDFLSGSA